MDAAQLARWTRFAYKGGIGRGTAIRDCVAQGPEDLMFMQGDEIVVLMSLREAEEGRFLGYCEGVVGQFHISDISLHGKLKKAVFARRSTSQPRPAPPTPSTPALTMARTPSTSGRSGYGTTPPPVPSSPSPGLPLSPSPQREALPAFPSVRRGTPESRRSLPVSTPSARGRSPSPSPALSLHSHSSHQPQRAQSSPARRNSQPHSQSRPTPSPSRSTLQPTPSPIRPTPIRPNSQPHPTPSPVRSASEPSQSTPSPLPSQSASHATPSPPLVRPSPVASTSASTTRTYSFSSTPPPTTSASSNNLSHTLSTPGTTLSRLSSPEREGESSIQGLGLGLPGSAAKPAPTLSLSEDSPLASPAAADGEQERKRARRTGIWGSPLVGPGEAGILSPGVLSPTALSPTVLSPLSATFPPHTADQPGQEGQDALVPPSLLGREDTPEERTPLAQTGFHGAGDVEDGSTPLPRDMSAGTGSGLGRMGSVRPVGGRPMPAAGRKEEAEPTAVAQPAAPGGVVDDRSETSEEQRLSMPQSPPPDSDNEHEHDHPASDGEFGIGLTLLQTGEMSESESELASLHSHSRRRLRQAAMDEPDSGTDDGEGDEADVSADQDDTDELEVYGGAARVVSRESRRSGPGTPPRSRPGSGRSSEGRASKEIQPREGSWGSSAAGQKQRSSRSSARSSRASSLSRAAVLSSFAGPSAGSVFAVRPPLVTRASTSTQASFSPADLYEAYELGMGSPAISLRSQRSPAAEPGQGHERPRGYFDFHLPEGAADTPNAPEDADDTLRPTRAQVQIAAEAVQPEEKAEEKVEQRKSKDQRQVPILASPPTASLAQRRRGMTNLLPPVEIEVSHPVRPPVPRSVSDGAPRAAVAEIAQPNASPFEGMPASARSASSFTSTVTSTATVTQPDGPTPRPAPVRRSVTLSALPSPASRSSLLSPAGSGSSGGLSPRSAGLSSTHVQPLHSPFSPGFSGLSPHPCQQARSSTLPLSSSTSRTLSPSPLSPTGSTSSRLSPANMASAIRARMEAQRSGTPSTPTPVEEPVMTASTPAPAAVAPKPRLVVVNLTPEQEDASDKKDEQEDEVVVFAPPPPAPVRPSHASAPVPPPQAMSQGPLHPAYLAAPRPVTSMPNTPLSSVPQPTTAPLQPMATLAAPHPIYSAPTTPSGPLHFGQMQQAAPSPSSPLHSLHSTLDLARKAHHDSPGTPTFRGHMSQDLLSAQGPVPIAFELSASGALVPSQRPYISSAAPVGAVPRTPQSRSATQPEAGAAYPEQTPARRGRPRSQSFSDFSTPFRGQSSEPTDSPVEERTPELYRTEDERDLRARPAVEKSVSSPLRIRPPPFTGVPASVRSPLPTSPLAQSATSDEDGQVLERPAPFAKREAASAPVTPLREDHDNLNKNRPALSIMSDSNPSSVVPTPSPPTMHARSVSLRSKLSMNALKVKKEMRPESPAFSGTGSFGHMSVEDRNHLVLQVEDAEFEMVKPIGVKSDEGSVEGVFDSPTSSASIVASIPAPSIAPTVPVWQPPQPDVPLQTPAQIEAHRNLEYRWVTLMQTLKPQGARKQKKVKKLVWEGIPNSVRGKVWAYLTDANARMLPGLFDKLASRGGERTALMVKDLERLFPDQPHLRDPHGSLVKLLQAYLSMVPDVQYDRELAMVAGNILSLSPEEEAFWTFVAVMDKQIRLYFALNPIQLDVDGQLFAKAVEWMDPSLAKLLFEQCGVSSNLLCKAWFASVFCSVLPPAHLLRVWDIYLLEGASFLFRTGLVILQSAKRHLTTSPTFPVSPLSFLTRPPANIFDPDPESFINRVASMRMRDDDLRRLRPKIEAQLKLNNTPQRPQIVNRDIIKAPTILNIHDTTKKTLASVS